MYQSANLATRLLSLACVVLAVCACTGRTEVIAQVGESSITARDVSYRQGVMAVRSGKELPAHLALLQLVQEALLAEVGRAYDVVVSEKMLAEEAARVRATSRDPETLARVRAVFGNDEAGYRRLVLQPILVNQLLHARFSLGHDIQAGPLGRAREVLATAQAGGATLPALADEWGGKYRFIEIAGGRILHAEGEGEELAPELAQQDLEWPDYDGEFVDQVVAALSVGELHPKVVEDRYSFMVVRLLSREGDDASLESVVFPKLTFDPWFHTHSQDVELTIHSQLLKDALLADVDVPYITDRLPRDE